MASPLTQSIISGSGGDFTSLASWESQNLNLVTLDSSSMAIISGNWVNPDATVVVIDGWNTDASHTITILTTGSARHSGKWSDTAYRLQFTWNTDVNTVLKIQDQYVSIKGLQIKVIVTGDTRFNNGIGLDVSYQHGIQISENIVVQDYSGAGSCQGIGINVDDNIGYKKYVNNNLIYGWRALGYYNGRGLQIQDSYVYNNTVVDCDYGYYSYDSPGKSVTLQNNISLNCTDGYGGTFETASNNYSDIAGDAPGTDAKSGSVLFLNSASYDFRLSPYDTVAKGYGKDLYNSGLVTWNNDIANVTRTSGSWDIGAFAYVSYYIPTIGFIINPYVKRFSSNILLLPG